MKSIATIIILLILALQCFSYGGIIRQDVRGIAANAVPANPYIIGNVNLVAGVGITITQSGQNITVTSTGLQTSNDRYVNFLSGSDVTGDGSSSKPWKTLQFAYTSITTATIASPITVHLLGGNNDTDVGTITGKPNIHLVSSSPIVVSRPITIVGTSGVDFDFISFNNIIVNGDFTWNRSDTSIYSAYFYQSTFNQSLTLKQTGTGVSVVNCFDCSIWDADLLPSTGGGGGFNVFTNSQLLDIFLVEDSDTNTTTYFLGGYNSAATTLSGGGMFFLNGMQFDPQFGSTFTSTVTAHGTPIISSDASSIPASLLGTSTLLLVDYSQHVSYTPAVPGNWSPAIPTQVKTALDELAASTGGGPFLKLSGGTMLGGITMSGNGITQLSDPVTPQGAATKAYVDNGLAQLNPKASVYAASTANFSATYANGVACVGATLTATVNGVFSIDGVSPPLGSRVLMKDQTSAFQSGVYTVTVVGTVVTPAILTRALDYDSASDMTETSVIPVENHGNINALTSWLQQNTITTCGTDNLSFLQYSKNPSSYLTTALPSGQIFVGNGSGIATPQSMSGDATLGNTGAITFSATGVVAGSYTSANITVDSKGRITAASNGSGSVTATASSNVRFILNDEIVPYINIDGPHYQAITATISSVNISILNSGTSGYTALELNQYRAGAFLAKGGATITANGGNPSSVIAPLSTTLSLLPGDVMTVDVTISAFGAPEAVTLEY